MYPRFNQSNKQYTDWLKSSIFPLHVGMDFLSATSQDSRFKIQIYLTMKTYK